LANGLGWISGSVFFSHTLLMEKLEFRWAYWKNFMRSSWERSGSIEDPPSPEPGDIRG